MKKMVFIGLFSILIYTRFIGLDWGLPYPMHPDERNMANAIQSLNCEIRNQQVEIRNCFNPHFFAYGQFPLYIGYLLIQIYHLIAQKLFIPITFTEAVMSLRVISAIASVINVFVLIKIARLLILPFINLKLKILNLISLVIFTLSPYFIQFSHFGTTESLLALFYSLIFYFSLQLFNKLKWTIILLTALFSGLAIGTKISSFLFLPVSLLSFILNHKSLPAQAGKIINKTVLRYTLVFLLLVALFAILFSPHNLISFHDFSGAIKYESAIALGDIKIFYTRQFEDTIPVWFQITKIFPYALGWPQFILALGGFFFLSWRRKEINLLRFAFLAYFIPNSFLYAKWTRFMVPIFPIFSLFSLLFLTQLYEKMGRLRQAVIYALVGLSIMPGIAYLSVYQNRDVRFTASEWIYINIPERSYILSETASVVDIPIERKKYHYVSFNFYELDNELTLQTELEKHLAQADYIVIPSRRVFKNHPRSKYPRLNDYYQKLFSGELGFQKIAEFTSYPSIELFGKTLFEFPDEAAEETWSVFDHPVVRIYKKL